MSSLEVTFDNNYFLIFFRQIIFGMDNLSGRNLLCYYTFRHNIKV